MLFNAKTIKKAKATFTTKARPSRCAFTLVRPLCFSASPTILTWIQWKTLRFNLIGQRVQMLILKLIMPPFKLKGNARDPQRKSEM